MKAETREPRVHSFKLILMLCALNFHVFENIITNSEIRSHEETAEDEAVIADCFHFTGK